MNLGEAFKKACHISQLAESRGIDPSELMALSDHEALDYIKRKTPVEKSNDITGFKRPAPPVNDITNRVAPQMNSEALLYPERAALAKRKREQEEKEAFAKSVANLKKSERDNLKFLMDKGGRFLIDSKVLSEMALNGESMDTDKLEELKLIERELIKDAGPFGGNMIQFRIMKKGRQIYELFRSQGLYD